MSEFGGKKASVGLGLAIALAISTLATMASIFSLGSGNNDYTVKVHFPTANGLIDGSDVFIGGVKVGVVNSVVVDPTPPADSGNSNFANPTSTAMATISIGKQYAPLHQGATAAIRPKSLLGEKYVAMTVGDPGRDAIPDGTTLPPDATSVNVELDQLINVFDEATRKQLQKLIDSLGTGLAGQGRNTNQTFQVGRQDLGNLAQVTDVLQARDAELKRIIDALSKITSSLATDQQRANYPDLLAHSDTVLKTLIAEDADVAQGIDRLNAFFGIVDASFAGRQQDFQAVLALLAGTYRSNKYLPGTISDLDALASTLGPQGIVALRVAQKTAPGVIAADLLFGSQPSKNASGQYTFTQNFYTRVMPEQGCLVVNTRTYNANGIAQDSPPTIRPGSANSSPVCTTPVFGQTNSVLGATPCGKGITFGTPAIFCGTALTGSLCVAFGFPSDGSPPPGQGPGCNGLTMGQGGPFTAGAPNGGLRGSTAPAGVQRGVLGLPLQQASNDSQATDQLLGYLLR
jgi:virulence factor Mce-like protein